MRKILFFLLLVSLSATVFAQERGKVTFMLRDADTKEGVMGAVIELYPTSNSDKKRYYTSGAEGKVEISGLSYGSYTMIATFLGYEDMKREFKVSAPLLNLGRLTIKENATKIETVVKAVKSLRTSQNGDTLSYNAGAFKVTNDADVEGLLKKMPGITITNGEVEAQGETVQKIFVDGKEFFGEDVNTAIKSLPAEAVDRIEVFNKLSDEAEFSGVDDGEGYKAINIVTKEGMRKGQFGQMYAGYGYQPQTDEVTSHHKYTAGGNVNFFNNDSRISVIGLFNNINQQNFSFEDILGVTGNTNNNRRGVGEYMVRPQDGVALVNSIGLNYSDTWGKRDNVKFQGSYFFNNTSTDNISTDDTWYEDPSPIDTLHTEGRSHIVNNNHRLNARLDWRISRTQSLMSRTSVRYQGYNPEKSTIGYQYGESGLLYQNDYNKNKYYGVNITEFLQYRLKLGKPGRTISINGRFRYSNNSTKKHTSSNDAPAIPTTSPDYPSLVNDYIYSGAWQQLGDIASIYSPIYQYIHSPSETYSVRGSLNYNEPIAKNTTLSFQYRFSYEDQAKYQHTWDTDSNYQNGVENALMTNSTRSGYWTHRIGPGFRYSVNKNTIVANVYYQRSSLDGAINGTQSDVIRKTYDNVLYFAMLNYAFNSENTIRLYFRSYTSSPKVTQLQNIFDVSTPQYLSIGNSNLNPSFTHRVNLHYINSNVEKGRTFMWMGMAQYQQNYISSSTWYNRDGFELPDEIDGMVFPKKDDGTSYSPQRITSYENMDGYWNLRTHVSLGLPLSFMKCNLNLMAGVQYTVVPAAIYSSLEDMVRHNYTKNYANNIGYDFSVTLGSNISENIDFTFSWNGTFNQAWNTAAGNVKNNYFEHTATGTLKYIFWKGFTLTASCSYVQYIGFTNKYDENYLLCNVYLGKKLFRNQRGEIQVGVNDIANQNTAFTRNTGSGYTQNLTNSVIGRYFSVQFIYNLRHFGKRGSKNMKDYDYKESKNSNVGMSSGAGGNRFGPRR